MKLKNSKQATLFFALMILLPLAQISAQTIPNTDVQQYLIHSRGMLHETVFNTGEIGQPTKINQTVLDIINPMMEWPPYVKPSVPTSSGTGYTTYPGQHNGYGSGVYISANYKGTTGLIAIGGTPNPSANRVAAICGGVTGSNQQSYLQWSWPVAGSFKKIENYPVLSDGSLNPAFNPNEAEEIITSKWNTNMGISVTRTSRAYSYPDFDDFIIYEYEFENNGIFFDVNTSQQVYKDTTLVDVYITFMYAISPSAFGEIRHYGNDTRWAPHVTGKYTMSFWDPDYGLLYNQVAGGADSLITAGFPEKDAANFLDWSRTGKYGGGLLSPQAAGFNVMYYDTSHLSIIDTLNGPGNQSPQYVTERQTSGRNINSNMKYVDLDQNGRIKQPYNYFTKNATMTSTFALGDANNFSTRFGKNNNYYAGPGMATYNRKTSSRFLNLPSIYTGRAIPLDDDYPFNANYPIRCASYGLYYLKPGDKIRFTTAEMVGFGADTSKLVVGGMNSAASGGSPSPFHPGCFWNRPVDIGGQRVTNNYVADFGIPDYVNSNVVTVQDVAHKAYEAYVGHTLIRPNDPSWDKNNPPTWPEKMPYPGIYTVPIPPPAPFIIGKTTFEFTVKLTWKRAVEDFETLFPSNVSGRLVRYNIYRTVSNEKFGPWKLIDTVSRGSHLDSIGTSYVYEDGDYNTFKVQETRFYAVTSVDEFGNESGKTNIIEVTKKSRPEPKLTKVYFLPNPWVSKSGIPGEDKSVFIFGLPDVATIYIYSFAGQLIKTIEHTDRYGANDSEKWDLSTRNNQDIASGMYFYVVTSPEGDRAMGKFVVIK